MGIVKILSIRSGEKEKCEVGFYGAGAICGLYEKVSHTKKIRQ